MALKKPEKDCGEEDCPFHGSLKYERYSRMRSRITAHRTPCLPVKVGDQVRIAECRPLSKTKSFVVVEVLKEA